MMGAFAFAAAAAAADDDDDAAAAAGDVTPTISGWRIAISARVSPFCGVEMMGSSDIASFEDSVSGA